MNRQTFAVEDYEIFYVTRAMIASRPRNLEGFRIPEAGWYIQDPHSGDIHGPYATARNVYAAMENGNV